MIKHFFFFVNNKGIDQPSQPHSLNSINIGITHVFSCINICRVPRMPFEHEADRPSVQKSSEGLSKC